MCQNHLGRSVVSMLSWKPTFRRSPSPSSGMMWWMTSRRIHYINGARSTLMMETEEISETMVLTQHWNGWSPEKILAWSFNMFDVRKPVTKNTFKSCLSSILVKVVLYYWSEIMPFKVISKWIKITVFWDITPYRFVGKYHDFDGNWCLHLQGRRMNLKFHIITSSLKQNSYSFY
jgi:hypothetical protein